jgi:hypothetical protein
MKGRSWLYGGVLALVILFFLNIGAFVVTDVGDDYPGRNDTTNSIQVGSTHSWGSMAVWESGTGLVIPGLLLLAIIESFIAASYRRKGAAWKKILMVVLDLGVLLFALLQLLALSSVAGRKGWAASGASAYYFTVGTTGTVFVLYAAVLVLIGGAILMLVQAFRASGQAPGDQAGKPAG